MYECVCHLLTTYLSLCYTEQHHTERRLRAVLPCQLFTAHIAKSLPLNMCMRARAHEIDYA